MSERKRAVGFALMDTAFTADAKFVRLARKAATPTAFLAAVGAFWLILADARRAKDATVNWDDYEEYAEQIVALKEVKLLNVNGFDGPTFDRWAPAYRVPARTQAYPNVPNRPPDKGGSEHGAYPSVPDGTAGTQSTLTSTHINSTQTNDKDARARTDNPPAFMGYRPKPGSHEGQHSAECMVCHPDSVKQRGAA